VDPEGNSFFSIGVNANPPPSVDDIEEWANATAQCLKEWCFNTLAAWSDEAMYHRGIPHTQVLYLGSSTYWRAWWLRTLWCNDNPRQPNGLCSDPNQDVADVYDPLFRWYTFEQAKREIQGRHQEDDHWLLGYFTDNEWLWGGRWRPLFDAFFARTRIPVILGVYLPTNTSTYGNDLGNFDEMTGKHHNLVMFYSGWEEDFPRPIVDVIHDNNSTPMITWEPWITTTVTNTCPITLTTPLDEIILGQHDAYIRRWATALRDWGYPILLRFAHEMNGNWYPWDGCNNNRDPNKYIAAWQHVHDLFQQIGATNAEWVWSVNHVSVPGEPWNDYNAYYPGDAYLDWVGVDGFNWGQSYYGWKTFDELFGGVLADFRQRYPQKPQIISEFASAPDDGGSKSDWIQDAYARLDQYPRLQAVVWFNENKERDWRVELCPECVEAYRRADTKMIPWGKIALVDLLKERYGGDIAAFNRAWGTQYSDWSDVYWANETPSGAEGDPSLIAGDKSAFLRAFAQQYYRVTHEAIRRYDPNHLILGSRFINQPPPDEVAEAMGEYVDVLSINVYDDWPNTGLLRKVHELSGKPVLISEFGPKDEEASVVYERYARAAIEGEASPFLVGLHWFPYWGCDCNAIHHGVLVDCCDQPCPVVSEMQRINRNLPMFRAACYHVYLPLVVKLSESPDGLDGNLAMKQLAYPKLLSWPDAA
jgi:hypothetical protein